MYYQFTGQPGHGKTVLSIEMALNMKAKADKLHRDNPKVHPYRELYVCNVRDFNHGAAGALELKPTELRKWSWHPDDPKPADIDPNAKDDDDETDEVDAANDRINPDFENAIILVDEAYEHRMFPRRRPGAKIPHHVWKVAKHRHYGIDFIMICQSPGKQMDDFLHDLMEEHYHVRRRFGLPFVHVKRWDRFERNPDKSEPITRTRRRYPTEIFKLYTSTKYDTSEKRLPWFYYAVAVLGIAAVIAGWWNYNNLRNRFSTDPKKPGRDKTVSDPVEQANGAPATVAPPAGSRYSTGPTARPTDPGEYAKLFTPRIPSQPWTAPIYDQVSINTTPPRIYCALSEPPGYDGAGNYHDRPSCSCITDQGTRYLLSFDMCSTVATNGQYEPFYRPIQAGGVGVPTPTQTGAPGAAPVRGIGTSGFGGQQARYGQLRDQAIPADPAFSGW